MHHWKLCIFDLRISYQTFGRVCWGKGYHTQSVPPTWEGYHTHYKNDNVSWDTEKKTKKPQGRFPKQVLKAIKMFITTKSSFSSMFYRKSHDYWWIFQFILDSIVLKHWRKWKLTPLFPVCDGSRAKEKFCIKAEIKALKLTLKCRCRNILMNFTTLHSNSVCLFPRG